MKEAFERQMKGILVATQKINSYTEHTFKITVPKMQAKCSEREANNDVNIGIFTLSSLTSLSAKAHTKYN